jgi:streptogramin lyase
MHHLTLTAPIGGPARTARGRRAARRARQVGLALTAAAALLVPADCTSHAGAGTPPSRAGANTAVLPPAPALPHLKVMASLKLHQITYLVPTPTALWALGGPNRRLSERDPRATTVVKTVRLPQPAGFGTYTNGSLWISSFADSVVMEVDPASGRVIRTIRGSSATPIDHPGGLVAIGSDLWVIQHRKAILTRISTRTGKVTGNVALPGHSADSPRFASGRIWVPLATTDDTVIARIDPATASLDGPPIHVGSITCATNSLVDGTLWLTSTGDPPCGTSARALDTMTSEVSPIQYGPDKDLYEIASAGGSTWASDTTSNIYRLDTRSGKVTPSLTLEGDPDFNRLLTAFGSLWVSRGDTGRIVRISVT